MEITVKTFEELKKEELYELLQLRAEVFVVEQRCAYQDLDGKDEKALHVLGKKGETIVAYSRIFKPGDYFPEANIGRVVVMPGERKYGYGRELMKASIEVVEQRFNESTVHLSAQTYLKNFYNSLGFKQVGEEYSEDGIPHIGMLRTE
ncbi:MAG: GNAT family N-acetyltransferase [Aurantibacter sp.]